jgi:hypothetical protein
MARALTAFAAVAWNTVLFPVLALCFVAMLASCSSLPAPEPQIVTKPVYVPVAVKCIDASAVPLEPGTVALPLDARLAADIAASKTKDLRVWGRNLLALIGPCTK